MKRSHLAAITFSMVLALLLLFSVTSAQSIVPEDWQYRKAITIDHTQVSAPALDTALYDFPLLVEVTASDAQDGGADIVFTADDGMTKLDHEIESYNNTTGHLVAWVRIPSLSSTTDTVIYMYYGNPNPPSAGDPTLVWNKDINNINNYRGVWHLDHTQSIDDLDKFLDSTGNTNHGTNDGSTDTTGWIADGQFFDGFDDYIDCGNASSLDIEGSMTVEAWVSSDPDAGPNRIFVKDTVGVRGKFMLWENGGNNLEFRVTDKVTDEEPIPDWYIATDQPITNEGWIHVVGVYDQSVDPPKVRLYKNGVEIVAVDGPDSLQSPTVEAVTIGASEDNQHNWEGKIDEVRISAVARSAEWIRTQYNNQKDPGSFYELEPGPWWDCAWSYRKKIVIDQAQGTEDLNDFPVLIKFTDDTDVADNADTFGADIVFTNYDGTEQLKHEIEYYDSGSGSLVAWVRIPTLSATTLKTVVYMYYGNPNPPAGDPTLVWDEYRGVWHLHDDFLDSTSNTNHGTSINPPDPMEGKVAGGQFFDGGNDYIDCGNDASLDITGSMTVEAWAYSENGLDNKKRIAAKDNVGDPGKFILWKNDSGNLAFIVRGADNQWYRSIDGSVPDGVWFHVVGVFDADNQQVRLYKDGVQVGVPPLDPDPDLVSNTESVTIGGSHNNNPPPEFDHIWKGKIDEVRISSEARSAEWIETEYTNQKNPASFLDIGDEETPESTGLTNTYYLDYDGDTFGDPDLPTEACTVPLNHVEDNTDCNDEDSMINPAALDLCDGIDNDCDDWTDEDYLYLGDSCFVGIGACYDEGNWICNETGDDTTCDAVEGTPTDDDATCNDIDDDCDNANDEDYVSTPTTCGIGACSSTGLLECIAGAEIDSCTEGMPAADDATCNGIDDDCDNANDQDYVSTPTTCGIGACSSTGLLECIAGAEIDSCTEGMPAADDATCNGIDDDCDGSTDEDLGVTVCGLGVCEHSVQNCVDGVDQVCDPLEGESDEACDTLDNDCDGLTDEEDAIGCIVYYRDSDEDTYGVTSDSRCLCSPEGDYTTIQDGDCDDGDAAVNPSAVEKCDDGIDNDCDGEDDVTPEVVSITAPVDPIQLGDTVTVTAELSGLNLNDTHTATIEWGDETTSEFNDDQVVGEIQDIHTYSQAGVYTITVTVDDNSCGSDSDTYQYVVVYDPNGGFVTGGGWINSPEGAYTPDPELTGKANFGFVSKYKKGATVPTGQTQFQFKVADLNFHSDTYDWLVIAGSKAQYKGTGTINGDGNYGFMLTAIDEKLTPSTDVDMFRIKIWDKDDGDAIVYDNKMYAEDDSDPTTEIGGGSIVIHKGKK